MQPEIKQNEVYILDSNFGPTDINKNWKMQTSEKVKFSGEEISSLSFSAEGWYPVEVPQTVMAGLLANNIFEDPYYGMNLRDLPGMEYKIGTIYSNQEMPPNSPFACSWWYRCEVFLPQSFAGKHVFLNLFGLNYRANVWFNSKLIGKSENIVGTFRTFEFDITGLMKVDAVNVIAIEVFPPKANDLAISWVDWNPSPPDKNMGIWKRVTISAKGPINILNPYVQTTLEKYPSKAASLSLQATLRNTSETKVSGRLRGLITGNGENIEFSEEIILAANSLVKVDISATKKKELRVANPRLWWPYQLGEPFLYGLELSFLEDNFRISDRCVLSFGIVSYESIKAKEGNFILKVNGVNVLVRGAGWAPDMFLRQDMNRLKLEFKHVKNLGLNTIRLEGKLLDDPFFDLADNNGIMIMAGLCCCDAWEKWEKWTEESKAVAFNSLRDQLYRLRNHPSVSMWLNGSDNFPPPEIERNYLDIEKEVDWPRPILSSATSKISQVTQDTGVKMTGPYDYVPPNYWYTATDLGGAKGFNTETSPGFAIPSEETLKSFIPEEKLWPINEVWMLHSGGGPFRFMDRLITGIEERYGKISDLGDFVWKSQAESYESQRAMFEAYTRNRYSSSGVIQWMLNNAWPSLLWHLYNYDLSADGGYYGSKKAMELLHVQYSYDNHAVVVSNLTWLTHRNLTVIAKAFSIAGSIIFDLSSSVDVKVDSVETAMYLPSVPEEVRTYFLSLKLTNSSGHVISDNLYWLSTKEDIFDFSRTEFYYTPELSYADLTLLTGLDKVSLTGSFYSVKKGENTEFVVSVNNESSKIAFLTRLRIIDNKQKKEVVPSYWGDNYISLLPKESRTIKAEVLTSEIQESLVEILVDGFNVNPSKISKD